MNLANKLTIGRVALVPLFVYFMSFTNNKKNILIALVIFIIASITDHLDGYIARKRNEVTTLGKFLDPLADKLLVTSALILLVNYDVLPAWIAIVIIAREFIVSGIRTVAASQNIIIAASWWGKIKTVIQIISIILLIILILISNSLNQVSHSVYIYTRYASTTFMYLALIITVISGIDYVVKNKNVINIKH